LVEAAWVAAWGAGAVLLLATADPKSRQGWRVLIFVGVVVLLFYRFALGSLGGLFPGI